MNDVTLPYMRRAAAQQFGSFCRHDVRPSSPQRALRASGAERLGFLNGGGRWASLGSDKVMQSRSLSFPAGSDGASLTAGFPVSLRVRGDQLGPLVPVYFLVKVDKVGIETHRGSLCPDGRM